MRLKNLAFFLFTLTTLFFPILDLSPFFTSQTVELVSVIDGDTIIVKEKKKQMTVRLVYIDAPEMKQKSFEGREIGMWSKNYLQQLLQQKLQMTNDSLMLARQGKDQYGRTLAVVWMGADNINLAMVKEGMALVYPKAKFASRREKSEFIRAHHEAKRKRLGLWSTRGFQAPHSFRKNNRKSERKSDKIKFK